MRCNSKTFISEMIKVECELLLPAVNNKFYSKFRAEVQSSGKLVCKEIKFCDYGIKFIMELSKF